MADTDSPDGSPQPLDVLLVLEHADGPLRPARIGLSLQPQVTADVLAAVLQDLESRGFIAPATPETATEGITYRLTKAGHMELVGREALYDELAEQAKGVEAERIERGLSG
jgi:DNA-binding HxlR family transcriptional regulator